MNRDTGSIADIVNACRDIAEFLENIDKIDFLSDKMILAAIKYDLGIIGEATKRLSKEFRSSHPTVPWKDMAGLRDRLVHAYDDIDLETIWDAATIDLPVILGYLEKLIPAPPPKGPAQGL